MLVAPVVSRERELVGEKVMLSPPERVKELVFMVAESNKVKVFPAPRVSVPVPIVIVLPLYVPAVMLPEVIVPMPSRLPELKFQLPVRF